MECLDTCPVTDKAQQDAIIDAAIKAAYLDPRSPTSLRAIAEMLPGWRPRWRTSARNTLDPSTPPAPSPPKP